MQDRPVCFECVEPIEHSPVFESPCGHETCASATFHGLCLMSWREKRDEIVERMKQIHKRWVEEHTGNEPERGADG